MYHGRVEDKSQGLVKTGMLYDFVTGQSELLLFHRRWLTSNVVPILQKGGSVSIIGSASRLGSEVNNQRGYLLESSRYPRKYIFIGLTTTYLLGSTLVHKVYKF